MAVDVVQAPAEVAPAVPPPPRVRRGPPRSVLVLGVLAAWVVLWIPLHGHQTFALDPSQLTGLHRRLNALRDTVERLRGTNPFFTGFVDVIRSAIDSLTTFLQTVLSQPFGDRPVPLLGWLGVVAVAAFAAYAFAGWRMALLTAAGFCCFGLLGYWQQSMDTLALTVAAVLVSLLFGIPFGIWMGLSRPVERIFTPVLDFMQAMPTFVYLAPLTLFFLIGPASAVIATVVYAAPPVIRITAHGIRGVAPSSLEASTSLGATGWQLLRLVRFPMAKRTIVVGVNQTVMCALSMVTIAALIDAPGLGQVVLHSLETLDDGTAFRAGLGIVIMAIVLDRVTTAASVRVEARYRRGGGAARRPWIPIAVAAVLTVVAVYLAYTFVWAAVFPGDDSGGAFGPSIAEGVNTAVDWIQLHLATVTDGIRNAVSYGLLNPLQALIADSPWYLVSAVVVIVGFLAAGWRTLPLTVVGLAMLLATGVWHDAMVTLSAVIVATVITMVLGLWFGVWMGRSARADRILRPVLDAAQVMPAFVYLVPFVGLFGATRLTAIIAAVVFAAPVAVKLIADGIRAVPETVVEAATSAGSTGWQLITRVQLPLARRSVVLATNQGLVYVLSMVVVGGLVGAGGLGYLVIGGFSQQTLYGKGLAAGLAIVLLGILLDRITQAAAARGRGREEH